MLKVEAVSFRYPGSAEAVLKDASLEMPSGGIFGLLGPNGAGKTTLISIIAGQLRGATGRVLWNGEPLEELRRRNMEEMIAGAKPKRDIISHGEYQGIHRGRQVDVAKKLFAVMGIARDDKPIRQDWVLRGFRQFDAPVSLVLTYDRILDPGAVCHFDLGALCYGLVLAAWDRGLGSVINGQGITRSDIVREVAAIPEEEVIMTCVAMGYPDDSFPANAVRSDREPNGDFVRYVGFAD